MDVLHYVHLEIITQSQLPIGHIFNQSTLNGRHYMKDQYIEINIFGIWIGLESIGHWPWLKAMRLRLSIWYICMVMLDGFIPFQ